MSGTLGARIPGDGSGLFSAQRDIQGGINSFFFGAAGPVVLGSFVFADFEIPASIAFGGQQQLTIHKLPGGSRVIDAMGRDDMPLAWEGTILSPDADSRAQALDEMRVAGKPLSLVFGSQAYTVVIAEFTATYKRPGMIGYKIGCAVLKDESQSARTSIISAAVQIYADINTALGYLSFVTTPPPSGSPTNAVIVAQNSAQIAAANDFHLGALATNQAISDLTAANGAVQSGLLSSAGVVQSAASRAPSGSVAATLPDLILMVQQAGTMALLAASAPLVARAQVNAVRGQC
jgi:hypothetical protein